MPAVLVNNFIRQINELENGSRWFDQSLRDKLDQLPDTIAFEKPSPALHSVAEHVSHMLEWRKECILRFNDGKRELMHSPDDWKDNDALRKIGWYQLKKELYESSGSMIRLIEGKEDTYLDTVFQDTEYTFKYLVEGILQHDIYHLGQIGVVLKLIQSQKEQ